MADQTEQIDNLLRRGNERGRFPKTTQGNPYGNVRVSQEEQKAINESDKMLIETVQRILSDQFPDASQMPGELMDMWQFLENQKQALGEANITGNSVSFKNKMTSDARANLQRIIVMASNLPNPMPQPSPNPIPMSRDVNPDQELIDMINASNTFGAKTAKDFLVSPKTGETPAIPMPNVMPDLSPEEKERIKIMKEIRERQSLERDPSGMTQLLGG